MRFHHAQQATAASKSPNSKNGEIFQQRNDADDDHYHVHDFLRPAVKRKHIDEIEHQDDDKERDENAYERIHAFCLSSEAADRLKWI
jgi:hypothetical protein